MTWSTVPGLIAAIAFLALVIFLAVPLIKLGRVFDELRLSVEEMTEHTGTILDEAAATVTAANSQMDNINTVTTSAAEISQNMSALTALVTSTLGRPLVKVGAFTYGVRRAFALRRDGSAAASGGKKRKGAVIRAEGDTTEAQP